MSLCFFGHGCISRVGSQVLQNVEGGLLIKWESDRFRFFCGGWGGVGYKGWGQYFRGGWYPGGNYTSF